MDRRQVLRRLVFFVAIAATIAALLAFKIKIALVGGKYLLVLAIIIGLVWLVTRWRR